MRVLMVIYDEGSFIHNFPLGAAYIAGAARKAGHEVEIYNQDIHHWPHDRLRQYLDAEVFDMVGVSMMAGYWQFAQLLEISDAINNSKNRPLYVLGGAGASPDPYYFLGTTQADVAAIGEGEETIVDLLDALANDRPLSEVKGIAYRDGKDVFVNFERELIEDLDTIALPAWDLFPIDYYRLLPHESSSKLDFCMPALSGRGCPFRCTFCYRIDKGFRPRPNAGLIEEIGQLQDDYAITYIDLVDDLLMSSPDRTEDICQAIIDSGLKFKWSCNGRLNWVTSDVIKMMKRAGCVFINYGIESVDDETMKNMKKGLTLAMVIKGVETTREEGMSAGLNMIFGNIGDNLDTLRRAVEFLCQYDEGKQKRTIRPVTPYPGSPLYFTAIERGLLKDTKEFYEVKHLNSDLLAVNFTDLTDAEFHAALLEANTCLLEDYHEKQLKMEVAQATHLYKDLDVNFRGYRTT